MRHAIRDRFAFVRIIVAMIAMSGGMAYAQANSNSLPNPYLTIDGWAKMPEGRTWGQTSQLSLDRDGNVWVAERCGGNTCADRPEAPILEFDHSGKLVKSFGAGMFVVPHGILVDRDGNVWATDSQGKDGKGQQVFKFNTDGKVLMTLGKAGVAGDGPDTFNRPSAVAIASSGDIFVGDGHGGDSNARIVKFSKDGKFIKTWGKKGPAPGEFETPHSLAFDSKGRSVGIIFETSSPFDTPRLMQELVGWTNRELQGTSHHPLLVVAVFIVRYLAIHPFQDGNGRLARVLTNLLLLRTGYSYMPYSSLERVIEENREQYYRGLRSAQGTLDRDESHLMDWLRFFLLCLIEQKDSLAEKVKREKLMSSLSVLDEKLLQLTRQHGRLTLTDALKLTKANRNTLKLHLKQLVQAGRLQLLGRGRSSWYEVG